MPTVDNSRGLCAGPQCVRPARVRGLCSAHYQQLQKGRALSPLAFRSPLSTTLEERFWARVNKAGPTQSHMDTPCWLWTGTRHGEGYGSLRLPRTRQNELAHRCSWRLAHCSLPESPIDQLCGERLCVRPDHLTSLSLEERFWAKVDRENGPVVPHVGTRCWIWHGARDSAGYGTFLLDGVTVGAHRAAWIFEYGPITDPEAVIRHECDVPSCVRHLVYGTEKDNCRDKFERGRAACVEGEANPRALVTEEQVREIRRRHAAGEKQLHLAAEFGLSKTAMGHIVHRRSWRDVA